MMEFVDGAEKTLRFSGKLTIYKCVELKGMLMKAIDSCASHAGTWGLDFGGVETADVAAVQLILALKKEIEARGGKTKVQNLAPSLIECLEIFNLKSEFER